MSDISIGCLAIFREEVGWGDRDEPDRYGLYRIMRATPSRFYFGHVAGTNFSDTSLFNDAGRPFNHHSEAWLDKGIALRRAVAWIADAGCYEAIVERHQELIRKGREAREDYSNTLEEARKDYVKSLGNMGEVYDRGE